MFDILLNRDVEKDGARTCNAYRKPWYVDGIHMTSLYSGSWLQIYVHFWETVVLQFVAAAAAEEEEERFEKLRRYMGGKFPHKFIN